MTEKANHWLIHRRELETEQEHEPSLEELNVQPYIDCHAGLNETPKGGYEQAPLSIRRTPTVLPLPSSNAAHLQTTVAVVQPLSCIQLFVTPWTEACQFPLSFVSPRICPNSYPLSQWCHSTVSSSVTPFSSCLQSFPVFRVYSNELALPIRRPKFWSFSFTISPSNEFSGLISFRVDWFVPLAVPGTLKSLLQHHSLKASILRHSALFIVWLSHPYMTTGKTIALARWTFVSKWCLCFLIN